MIGGKIRQNAATLLAQALVQDPSPEVVRALAEAMVRIDDPHVRVGVLAALWRVKDQACIDAVCAVWADTRHREMGILLKKSGWVASAPPRLRVLSALRSNRLETIVNGGARTVALLLRANEDVDPVIAKRARLALQSLENPAAQEEVCRLVIEEDHPLAREAALAAQYAPRASQVRALFYLLTEQWEKYESLDFDWGLLRTAYQVGDERLRERITNVARKSGRAEFVAVVAGGRKRRRLAQMTDEEWQLILALLGSNDRWSEMWQLAQVTPAVWSAKLLRRLRSAGWIPVQEEEQAGFAELARLAEKCEREVPKLGSIVRCHVTLEGYASSAYNLAISPDGRFLAGASIGYKVRLWSLPDGGVLKTLTGHNARVNCLVISPDGQTLVSGSDDHTVQLWRLPDGAALKTLKGHRSPVNCLAISPDGQLLASGAGKTVRVSRLPNGERLELLRGHTGSVLSVAISPDGQVLASGSGNGTLRLWQLPDLRRLKTLRGHLNSVECLGSGPDRQVLAIGCKDGTVHLHQLLGGRKAATLKGHTRSVTCLAISPDGQVLASGSTDKTVRLWRLAGGAEPKTLRGHARRVICLAFNPDGQVLASGSTDKTVRLWRLPDGAELKTLRGHARRVICLAISPDGRVLASGSTDNTVRLWTSAAFSLSLLPIAQTSVQDMSWVQDALQDEAVVDSERGWLEFILALMHWRRRFDIEVEEAPRRIAIGEFDIEIDG